MHFYRTAVLFFFRSSLCDVISTHFRCCSTIYDCNEAFCVVLNTSELLLMLNADIVYNCSVDKSAVFLSSGFVSVQHGTGVVYRSHSQLRGTSMIVMQYYITFICFFFSTYKLQITSEYSIAPPTEWMGALNNESYACA